MTATRMAAAKPKFFMSGMPPIRPFSSDNFMSGSNANYIDYMYE